MVQMMEKKDVNYIINLIILIGFIIIGITGLLLFPLIFDFIGSSIIPVFLFIDPLDVTFHE